MSTIDERAKSARERLGWSASSSKPGTGTVASGNPSVAGSSPASFADRVAANKKRREEHERRIDKFNAQQKERQAEEDRARAAVTDQIRQEKGHRSPSATTEEINTRLARTALAPESFAPPTVPGAGTFDEVVKNATPKKPLPDNLQQYKDSLYTKDELSKKYNDIQSELDDLNKWELEYEAGGYPGEENYAKHIQAGNQKATLEKEQSRLKGLIDQRIAAEEYRKDEIEIAKGADYWQKEVKRLEAEAKRQRDDEKNRRLRELELSDEARLYTGEEKQRRLESTYANSGESADSVARELERAKEYYYYAKARSAWENLPERHKKLALESAAIDSTYLSSKSPDEILARSALDAADRGEIRREDAARKTEIRQALTDAGFDAGLILDYAQRLHDSEQKSKLVESLQQFSTGAEDAGKLEKVARGTAGTAISAVTSLLSSIGGVSILAQKAFGESGLEDYRPVNTDSGAFAFSHATTGIRSAVGGQMGKTGQFAYNTLNSVIDNAARMLVSKGVASGFIDDAASIAATENVNKIVSNLVSAQMTSQVFTNSFLQRKEAGATDTDALLDALVEAMVESATEKLSVDAILKNPNGLTAQALANSFIAEGTEEMSSAVLSTIYDELRYGDESELHRKAQQYIDAGVDEKQAWKNVLSAYAKEVLLDGLAGSISGLGMSAASELGSAVMNRQAETTIMLGLASPEGSASHQIAQSIQQQMADISQKQAENSEVSDAELQSLSAKYKQLQEAVKAMPAEEKRAAEEAVREIRDYQKREAKIDTALGRIIDAQAASTPEASETAAIESTPVMAAEVATEATAAAEAPVHTELIAQAIAAVDANGVLKGDLINKILRDPASMAELGIASTGLTNTQKRTQIKTAVEKISAEARLDKEKTEAHNKNTQAKITEQSEDAARFLEFAAAAREIPAYRNLTEGQLRSVYDNIHAEQERSGKLVYLDDAKAWIDYKDFYRRAQNRDSAKGVRLPDSVVRLAFDSAYERQASQRAEKKAELDDAAERINAVAEARGLNIRARVSHDGAEFSDRGGIREKAFVDPSTGEIVFNGTVVTSSDFVYRTLAHELIHPGAKADTELVGLVIDSFQELYDGGYKFDAKTKRILENLDAEIKKLQDRYQRHEDKLAKAENRDPVKISEKYTREELAGNLLCEVFDKLDLMQEVLLHEPSLGERIKSGAKRLRDALTGSKSERAKSDRFDEILRTLNENLTAALEKASRNPDAYYVDEKRYAITEESRAAQKQDELDRKSAKDVDKVLVEVTPTTQTPWWKQVDDRKTSDPRSALYIPETSNILADVGLPDLPLCMTKNHLNDIMHAESESNPRWHGIDDVIVKRLPELLSKPAMILDSWSNKGDIVVVTTEVDSKNRPIVVAIHPNGSAVVDGVRGPANFITSVYGRENFAPKTGQPSAYNFMYLALRHRAILYWDKEKSESLCQAIGLHLPAGLNKVRSDEIIREYSGYVKGQSPQRLFMLSEEDTHGAEETQRVYSGVQTDLPGRQRRSDLDVEIQSGRSNLATGGYREAEIAGRVSESDRASRPRNFAAESRMAEERTELRQNASGYLEGRGVSQKEVQYSDRVGRGRNDGVLPPERGRGSASGERVLRASSADGQGVEATVRGARKGDRGEIPGLSSYVAGERTSSNYRGPESLRALDGAAQTAVAEKEPVTASAPGAFDVAELGGKLGTWGAAEQYVNKNLSRDFVFAEELWLANSPLSDYPGLMVLRLSQQDGVSEELKYPITERGLDKLKADLPKLLEKAGYVDSKTWRDGSPTRTTIVDDHQEQTVDLLTAEETGLSIWKREQAELDRVGFKLFATQNEILFKDAIGLTQFKTKSVFAGYGRAVLQHERLHAYMETDNMLYFQIRDAIQTASKKKPATKGKGKGGRKANTTPIRILDSARKTAEEKWHYAASSYTDAVYKHEMEVFCEAFAGNTTHFGSQILQLTPIVQKAVAEWESRWDSDPRSIEEKTFRTDDLGRIPLFEERGFDVSEDLAQYEAIEGDYYDSYSIVGSRRYALDDDTPESSLDAMLKAAYNAYTVAQEEAAKSMPSAADIGSPAQRGEPVGTVIYHDATLADPEAYEAARAIYRQLIDRYGAIRGKDSPVRDTATPRSTAPGNKVSQTVATVLGARATPDSRVDEIKKVVTDGKVSYVPGTNAKAIAAARGRINREGFQEVRADWSRRVHNGETNGDLVTLGAVLLNNAGNANASGKEYVGILVDYTLLLRNAGQALQAAKIIKKLTPEGKLYAVQKTVDNINEKRKKRSQTSGNGKLSSKTGKGSPKGENIRVEEWMEQVGKELAASIESRLTVSGEKAKTVTQTILADLKKFSAETLPKQNRKMSERSSMDRLRDLFENRENYEKAWAAAKKTMRVEFGAKPETMAAINDWMSQSLDYAALLTEELTDLEDVKINEELAAEYLRAETDEERDEILDLIHRDLAGQIQATGMEKFTALRYLSMLGNLRTQVRNVVGNLAFQPVRMTSATFQGLTEALISFTGVKIERTTSALYDMPTFKGAFKEYQNVRDAILSGGKYQEGDRTSEEIEKYRKIFRFAPLEAYRKATNWAMDTGDSIFCSFTFADALSRYMKANRTTWAKASPELQDAARAYAIREAAEATYRDNNQFAQMISRTARAKNDSTAERVKATIMEGVLPFRKTPANILARAYEYSPLGLIDVAVKSAKVARGAEGVSGADIVRALSKTVTGSGLTYLGFVLASMGCLLGKAPDDDKEKDFWDLRGYQEYALLHDGQTYTLDWLAPECIPLFLGANLHQSSLENGLTLAEAAKALGALSDPLLSMSMLQGVNDALENASSYGDDSALTRFTGNALWGYFSQIVPTVLGQAERATNNTRMATYVDKNNESVPDGVQRLLGKLSAKTPGWDYAQIIYTDAWGRTQQNAQTETQNAINQFVSPGYASTIEESGMERELLRLYEVTGESSVLISAAPKYFTVDGERKDLTGAEYVTFNTERGQTAYAIVTALVESEAYAQMSDAHKAKAIEYVYDFATQAAKYNLTDGAYKADTWVTKAMTAAYDVDLPVETVVLYRTVAATFEEAFPEGVTSGGEVLDVNAYLRRQFMDDPSLTDAQKSALDDMLSDGKWVPEDINADYTNEETFLISQQSESAQKKYGTLPSHFNLSADKYVELYGVYNDKELTATQKKEKMAKTLGDYDTADDLYKYFGADLIEKEDVSDLPSDVGNELVRLSTESVGYRYSIAPPEDLPTSYKDPNSKVKSGKTKKATREWVLTSTQQEYYDKMRKDLYSSEMQSLIYSSEYINASDDEKCELIVELKSDVSDAVKEDFIDWLSANYESTPCK